MIHVKKFHRTRLLQPEIWKDGEGIKAEFLDLYQKFLRNRVWIQVERTEEYTDEDEEKLVSLFEHNVVNECENGCAGFWSVDFKEGEDEKLDVYVMFELEDDLKRFIHTGGMIFKLTA